MGTFLLAVCVCARVWACTCVCFSLPTISQGLLLTDCLSNHVSLSTNTVRLVVSLKQAWEKHKVGLHLTFVFKFVFHKEYFCPPTPMLPHLFQTGGVPTLCCVCSSVCALPTGLSPQRSFVCLLPHLENTG